MPEFVAFAEAELRARRPGLSFLNVSTRAELDALDDATLAAARLIGYATGVVVPAAILLKLGYGAYNFHPGPPELPGWDPIRFALYQGVRDFGVTAHAMTTQVDAGPIVGVQRCRVRESPGYLDFQAEMVKALLELFRALSAALALAPDGPPPIPVAWGPRRRTRADAEALCRISPDVAPEELSRRIAAFGAGEIALRPTITLHGARFVYAPDELFRKA